MITKKTANQLSSGICEAVAEKPSGFGKRMLEKLGWQEGTGLGANGQGMKESVRVSKKDDTKGLGAREAELAVKRASNSEGDWWNDAFKKAASALPDKIVNRDRSDSSSSSSSSSSSDSDDNGVDLSRLSEADRELFLMCGKRRLGRRANRAQKGKWKREAEADKEFLAKYVGNKSGDQVEKSSYNCEKQDEPKLGAEESTQKKEKRKKKAIVEEGSKEHSKEKGKAKKDNNIDSDEKKSKPSRALSSEEGKSEKKKSREKKRSRLDSDE